MCFVGTKSQLVRILLSHPHTPGLANPAVQNNPARQMWPPVLIRGPGVIFLMQQTNYIQFVHYCKFSNGENTQPNPTYGKLLKTSFGQCQYALPFSFASQSLKSHSTHTSKLSLEYYRGKDLQVNFFYLRTYQWLKICFEFLCY